MRKTMKAGRRRWCWWWRLTLATCLVLPQALGQLTHTVGDTNKGENGVCDPQEIEVLAEESEEETKADSPMDWVVVADNVDDVWEPDECSRFSPKEVFHTIVHPRLLMILDEFNCLVDAILVKVEEGLTTTLPHLDHSPIGDLKVEELFPEARHFLYGTMRDVYEVIREAWRELSRAHLQAHNQPQNQLLALGRVKDAQTQGEQRLVASLQDLAITVRAIVYNTVHSVQVSLKLPEGTDDHHAAQAIDKQLPKIAPNFLGAVMGQILRRGTDPSNYRKIVKQPLRSINPLVVEMHQNLTTLLATGGEDDDLMEGYWRQSVAAAHWNLQQDPLVYEDYHHTYQREGLLLDIVLQLMASF